MAGREADFAAWEALWQRIDSFVAALGRNKAKNVNAAALRKQAREIVIGYFDEQRTSTRPGKSAALVSGRHQHN